MKLTKAEKKCFITLLRNERKKASKKAMLAEHPSVRMGWDQVGQALNWAVELMERDLTGANKNGAEQDNA